MLSKITTRVLTAVFVVALLTLAGIAVAASFSVSYPAGQDTIIQTTIIPIRNRLKCRQFGLTAACTTANLATRGCVAFAFPNKNYNSCTIFTSDAAGETLLIQESSDKALLDLIAQRDVLNHADFIAQCQTQNQAAQNAACTAVGAPPLCNPCP
jgi:hypothetical protein